MTILKRWFACTCHASCTLNLHCIAQLNTLTRLLSLACLFAISLGIPIAAMAQEQNAEPVKNEVETGRRIYAEGVLPSGALLTGTRFGKNTLSGAEAACVNCHRRSGMGQVEGDILVPPITGNFLYATHKDMQYATMDPRFSKAFNQSHEPYTDASFAKAVDHGINNQGREMNVAMPRFNLSEAELKAVTAYLSQLSSQWSPGVSESKIRFATVITPDVDPVRRKAFVDMLQTIVRQKNGSTVTGKEARTRHHMTSAAELILGTERKWELDVWELNGEPETWGKQLAEQYQKQPVFALLSGLSYSTWQPVHDFCDKEQVPCWFPSVDMPAKSQSQYAFYFSSGVLLEANVLAHQLLNGKHEPKHLIQIYREDAVGLSATQELSRVLAGSAIKVENRALISVPSVADSLRHALAGIKSGDAVVFWLHDDDMKELAKLKPQAGINNYFSSRLSQPEKNILSEKWKENSHFVYLYELPENRKLNLDYFRTWMNSHHFVTVDEAMQTEVFFSTNFMTDTISEMLNNLYREYLLERSETMINKREGSKAEQETRDRFALGNKGELEKRHGNKFIEESQRVQIVNQNDSAVVSHGTTMYPHLSLGPEQRFASKGGYIVKYAEKQGNKLIDESGWIVP